MVPCILGIGTASPAHTLDQERALALARVYSRNEFRPRVLDALYRQSGIETRGSVVAHADSNAGLPFFVAPSNEDSEVSNGPGTAERMAVYEKSAVELAVVSCSKALDDAGETRDVITHLVVATCTGFFAPGLDVLLIKRLGLNPGISRVQVGFMGCHGAFNALQAARALAAETLGARVLVCATELCTLHMQYGGGTDGVVANALFADGSGAVVVGSENPGQKVCASLKSFASQLLPDSEDAMSWRIGNHGFQMTLSARVPVLIEKYLSGWMQEWLARQELKLADIAAWAVHPGGPRILDAVQRALELPDSALKASREILSAHGNMSSPTVFFILDQMRRGAKRLPSPCVMLGFGPGLVAEAALLTVPQGTE